MADTSKAFTVVVTPGNGSAIIVGYQFDIGPSVVRRILLTWPPGCGGLVGVQIQAGGSGAFPQGDNTFFVFDDYTYAFDVANQTDGGKWGALFYNADYMGHGIQVVFEYDYIRAVGQQSAFVPVAL